MYPIYLRVYWQKMADIELWRVPMSAFRSCVRSESAGQCPWVIAKRAPQMPGGQGVAGSNPVHPTRIIAGQRLSLLACFIMPTICPPCCPPKMQCGAFARAHSCHGLRTRVCRYHCHPFWYHYRDARQSLLWSVMGTTGNGVRACCLENSTRCVVTSS